MMEQQCKRVKGYYMTKLDMKNRLHCEPGEDRRKRIRKPAKVVAKQARNRKKVYLDHLESKVKKLENQNAVLIDNYNRIKMEVQAIAQTIKSEESTGFEKLAEQFKRLNLNIEKNDEYETSRSLSILRDKFGISGRERLKNIDEVFNRVINIMMPMHYRLLMENSSNNREFYSLLSPNLNKLVRLEERQREVLINFRPQIIRKKKEYDQILNELAEIRLKIRAQNAECQAIIDEIQDKMSPIFVGRVLIALDCCRSKENLQNCYPFNYWEQMKRGLMDAQQPPVDQYMSDMEILDSLFM